MADDAPWLRTSVLDTLLDVAGRNVSRSNAEVAVFEVAKVARPHGTVPAPLPGAEERLPLITYETVLMETPARTATSLIPAINTPYHEMVIIHDAVSILSHVRMAWSMAKSSKTV